MVDGVNAQRDFDGPGGNGRGVVGSCFTESDGTCEFDYVSQERGLDRLQAWIDPTRLLGTPPAPEDKDTDASPQVGSNSLDQDVVSAQWTFENAALKLEAGPESELEKKVFTQHVLDVNVSTIPTRGGEFAGGESSHQVLGARRQRRCTRRRWAQRWRRRLAWRVFHGRRRRVPDRLQLRPRWCGSHPALDRSEPVLGGEACGNDDVDDGEIFLTGKSSRARTTSKGNPLDDPAQDVVGSIGKACSSRT